MVENQSNLCSFSYLDKAIFQPSKIKADPFMIFFIRYVMLSIIGATIWAAGITAWNCIFQMKRLEWGELGDNLSAYIPTG